MNVITAVPRQRGNLNPTGAMRSQRTPIMAGEEIQYVSDASGKAVAVIVPIELWREIESEKETAYLLKSEAMKRRLLEAKQRQQDLSLEEARERVGL